MKMSDIETMIDYAANQDFNAANNVFQELISQRMTDALDAEKVNVADQIFNGVEPEEAELADDDFEDGEQLELDLDDDAEEYTDYEFDEVQDMNQETKVEAGMQDYEEE